MGFSRQEHGSGLPCPPPGGLPNPGIEPAPPALGGRFFPAEPPGEAPETTLVGKLLVEMTDGYSISAINSHDKLFGQPNK